MRERRRNGFSASSGFETRTASPVKPTSACAEADTKVSVQPSDDAEADQDVLDRSARPLQRRQAAGLGPGRDVPWHVAVAEGTGDLLNDVIDAIGLAPHVGPVGRHHHRDLGRHLLEDLEADRLQQPRDLLGVEAHPDLALHTRDGHRDHEWLGYLAAHVEHAVGHAQRGHALGQQLAEPLHRRLDRPRVAPTLEARGGLGAQAETLGRARDRHRREVRGFQQDLGRGGRDLRGGAAHDAADADRVFPRRRR